MRDLWAALARFVAYGEPTKPAWLCGVTASEWRFDLRVAEQRERAYRTRVDKRGQKACGFCGYGRAIPPFSCLRCKTTTAAEERLDYVNALRALLPGKCRWCSVCSTPMLRGFRVGGRAITRARKFCNKACEMAFRRRKGKDRRP